MKKKVCIVLVLILLCGIGFIALKPDGYIAYHYHRLFDPGPTFSEDTHFVARVILENKFPGMPNDTQNDPYKRPSIRYQSKNPDINFLIIVDNKYHIITLMEFRKSKFGEPDDLKMRYDVNFDGVLVYGEGYNNYKNKDFYSFLYSNIFNTDSKAVEYYRNSSRDVILDLKKIII